MKTIWQQSITMLLLISATLTSIIPSSKTTQTLDINMPANCLKLNNNNKCSLCERNYQLQYGICVESDSNGNEVDNSQLSPPCGDSASCGQALNFKSESQLKMFLSKYTKPRVETLTQNIIGNKQNTNTNINTNININTYANLIGNQQNTNTFSNPYTNTYLQRMMRNINFNLVSNPMKLDFNMNRATSSNLGATIDQNRVYSKTNNQIAGVDEADLIKTDGTYIYTISNSVLSILIGYPYDRSRVLSELNFQDFRPSAIFVQGDVLAVFGVKETVIQKPNFDQSGTGSLEFPTLQTKSQTHIRIYDVQNRIHPILKNQITISGSYFNGRKLDRNGFMYLLTTQPFQSQKLPWYDLGAGKTSPTFTNIFYYPKPYLKPTFINIICLDLKNTTSTIKMKTVCSEAPTKIFMSEYYLYLFSSYIDNNTEFTQIKKIYVFQNYIQPFADGNIVGKVLNQFCIDQKGDFLRVVTTTQDGIISSNVVVLNFYLQVFGMLRGVAKGQDIKATRFYGNRLYLAASTAKNPFFVISLLYPKRPTILGEVKIQGFPNYLQLYDEQTVIGLGQQKNVNDQQLGLKISIFNVSDVRNPRETTTFQLDKIYANSIAQTEHKAFLFSKAKNLLVIPSYLQSETVIFNGAFIFYINSSSIQLKAVSNHILNRQDEFSNRYVQRSLYIQDHIYTKSKCLMKLNKIGGKYEGLRNIVIPCIPKEQILTQTLQIPTETLIPSK